VSEHDKEEVTGEWGILAGVKELDSEHVDRISLAQSIAQCLCGVLKPSVSI
jgi:hypothetical protein